MSRSSTIQSVERAFAVLRALDPAGQAVSLAAIAGTTGLPKSTASRLLSTMVGIGVVEKISEAGYVVGRELRAIAHPGVGPSRTQGWGYRTGTTSYTSTKYRRAARSRSRTGRARDSSIIPTRPVTYSWQPWTMRTWMRIWPAP